MDEESALERQTGPAAPRKPQEPIRLGFDPVWHRYCNEYLRLKALVGREQALHVFDGLLEDPERKDAAELMIASGRL